MDHAEIMQFLKEGTEAAEKGTVPAQPPAWMLENSRQLSTDTFAGGVREPTVPDELFYLIGILIAIFVAYYAIAKLYRCRRSIASGFLDVLAILLRGKRRAALKVRSIADEISKRADRET